LEEIIKDHPVFLNRAPTLHKLSIQAFYPILIEGSAIRLHPAVCSGFNADFDGDQMAVHVPLSKKAIDEARERMLPQFNLLRPADGSPITTPASKEMALGIFYLTSVANSIPQTESIFASKEEAIFAYQVEKIDIRQLISVMIDGKIIDTTVGRIIFNEVLPESFDFINEPITSSHIKKLFTQAFKLSTDKTVLVEMIDAIKSLGFFGGTISGLSFGIFDPVLLAEKSQILAEADKKISEHEQSYAQGLITAEEKKRLGQELWIEVTEEIADKTWNLLKEDNPIRIVIDAKVGRASRDQVKQIAAIRGLVVDPLGKIVELPIKSNFKEGLSVFEYVTSSRGSRKGLTDTALKTADAGYLTRRLVDVAHDVIVRLEDCGVTEGLPIRRADRPKTFGLRIVGRILAEDVKSGTGAKAKVLAVKGSVIEEEKALEIDAAEDISEVTVFSPLNCKARYGICQKCYGIDLSTKNMVEIGTPVGVLAAQSIGEPGTQLTLKTKHAAGSVGVDVTQGLPRVEELIEVRNPKVLAPLAEISGKVRVDDTEAGWKVTVTSTHGKPVEEREYIVPKSISLTVADKQLVETGEILAKGSLDIRGVLSIKGLRAAQEYLVAEVQKVYESQGIPIHDKHFEIIVRKMSDEVKIATSGDTSLLPGELVDKAVFEEENEKVLAAGGEPASAQQVVLGITRRALFTESWLSAASFQNTTEILTAAALQNKEDHLYGLKENVIIGRLIPVTPERAMLPRQNS
jgi:DNA-directed RNA polymerase subunit beta'